MVFEGVDLNEVVASARESLSRNGERPSLRRVVRISLVYLDRDTPTNNKKIYRLNNRMPLGSTLQGAATQALKKILEEDNGSG